MYSHLNEDSNLIIRNIRNKKKLLIPYIVPFSFSQTLSIKNKIPSIMATLFREGACRFSMVVLFPFSDSVCVFQEQCLVVKFIFLDVLEIR